MSDTVHTEEKHGLRIKIRQDMDPMNPWREFDNFGHMICFHGRYDLGEKHSMSVEEAKEMAARADVVALPLFLYDHSGITMSTNPFSCPWDSGQVGIIYATYEEIRKEYSQKRVTKKTLEKVRKLLVAQVKTYDDYLTGNVYGYEVETLDGEHLESCWGFYGDYNEEGGVLDEARAVVESMTHKGTTDHTGQKLLAEVLA
jgi:hypothetical protein